MMDFPPRRIVVSSSDAPAASAAASLARLWDAAVERAPARELRSRAEEGGRVLIVASTRGRGGLDPALLASGVPVLAVPEAAGPLHATRILAPWSGRSYATRTLRYAGRLASSLRAELRVMFVAPDRLAVDETDSALERRLGAILGDGGDPAWSLRVRAGDAREQIMREAASGRYGLIVVASRRRPFSTDALLGSTAARLLRGAPVPVLAFPCGRPSRAPAALSAH